MRRGDFTPIIVLCTILAFCLWNGYNMSVHTNRWGEQLDQVERLVRQEKWLDAEKMLSLSLSDWMKSKNWLHIVSQHSSTDNAESLYHRCLILIESQDNSEFLVELADLKSQLDDLYETERLSIGNIL